MQMFCVFVSVGLALLAVAWGIVLLVALPRGLGQALLGSIWRPTYPLVLPITAATVGGCLSQGASVGLHALGVARRSMRAMIITSVLFFVLGIAGAFAFGTAGAVAGSALASWVSAVLFWLELRAALRERREQRP
jgi:hypothetical protein